MSLLLAGSPTCSALLPYGDEMNFVEDDEGLYVNDDGDGDEDDFKDIEEDIMY